MTALPVAWAALETALRDHRPIHVAYHGHQRLICPHALSWKNGRPLLLDTEPAPAGETADNYNPAHPFNDIDELTTAIPPQPASTPRLGTTQQQPKHPR